ncbi:MAG: SDR family oxidoreductase [Betaproteobacteria bacterium]|nr:SDR family oxidoreductase [Betaproteobacteria bacterium]
MAENHSRVALVTGASSGIGEATARKFVQSGYAVVGVARSAAKLEALEAELGSAFCAVAGDAGDPAVLEGLFDTAQRRFGRPVDLVVANAGRGLGGAVTDADLSQFADVLHINVTGTLALLQQAANHLVAQQAGAFPKQAADIVIIGSVVGRHISPFSAVYGATKFAVHSLAEGLRREVGPKGVRVSLVEPGVVLSGFQQVAGYGDDTIRTFNDRFGPLLYGEDVANTIHFMVSQPPHVHLSDVMVRPTRQDYP